MKLMVTKLLDFENHWFSHLPAKINWSHLHIQIAFALALRIFIQVFPLKFQTPFAKMQFYFSYAHLHGNQSLIALLINTIMVVSFMWIQCPCNLKKKILTQPSNFTSTYGNDQHNTISSGKRNKSKFSCYKTHTHTHKTLQNTFLTISTVQYPKIL